MKTVYGLLKTIKIKKIPRKYFVGLLVFFVVLTAGGVAYYFTKPKSCDEIYSSARASLAADTSEGNIRRILSRLEKNKNRCMLNEQDARLSTNYSYALAVSAYSIGDVEKAQDIAKTFTEWVGSNDIANKVGVDESSLIVDLDDISKGFVPAGFGVEQLSGQEDQ